MFRFCFDTEGPYQSLKSQIGQTPLVMMGCFFSSECLTGAFLDKGGNLARLDDQLLLGHQD